ncbi:MAG TPA: potassium uptake system protein [Peptococcaceae bacterium]|nr:MAG: K+ uptake transporter trka family protein [Clostridia bacterium 41_269]HBT19822.1 potassium uptake system protein [Peptococcaceae bacterium]
MGQYVVIGLGRFGESVARTLSSLGHEVLVIDKSEEKVQEIADFVTTAIKADAQNEEFLRSVDIASYDAVVVAMAQSVEANILVNMLLKDLGVKYIVAKAQSKLHGEVLEKIGVNKIIYPEWDMGERVARALTMSHNILDYVEISPEHTIVEIAAPEEFVGKTLRQLDLRARCNISILAAKKGDNVVVAPGGEYIIDRGDILVAIGSYRDLRKLENKI